MGDQLTYGLVLLFALAILARLAFHVVGMFRNDDLVLLVGTMKIAGERDAAFNVLLAAIHAAGLRYNEPTGTKPRLSFGASLDPPTCFYGAVGATNCGSR